MTRGTDSRRLVHVETHIATIDHKRLACVDAHADTNRSLSSSRLSPLCGCQRIGSTGKGIEEPVTRHVDLDPATFAQSLANMTSVFSQDHPIALATDLCEQLGRALDVHEEEGDGA